MGNEGRRVTGRGNKEGGREVVDKMGKAVQDHDE